VGAGQRGSLEERLAAALAEDTSLPTNPNPLALPELPDLRELATIAALEVSDAEVADWTPKVHGILSWFGKLNEVDLSAVRSEGALYRDAWVMPLRGDDPVDFANRDAMFAECKTWQKPFVKVPKVDVKESDAAAAATAAVDGEDAASASTLAVPAAAATGNTVAIAVADDVAELPLTPELLGMEFKVGRVLAVRLHPDADKLFIEEVDCGEEGGPRTICSGLVPYMSPEDIMGKNVVVLANLKARSMAGVQSAGMLLCASNGLDGDARVVELLMAPEGAAVGERLTWGGAANEMPHGANKVAKKKIWEKVQPGLVTTDGCAASWNGTPLVSAAGAVTCTSLKGGSIS